MIIGVPREVKKDEHRVAMTPAGAGRLKRNGHRVFVETDAGIDSGVSDADYRRAGAQILRAAKDVFAKSDMIVKVKEPQPVEYPLIRRGQILFTYFHLAASKPLTLAMMKSGAAAVAYETVEPEEGGLPLLTPMSEVAGRMAVQEGARCLEQLCGGRGVLLGGVPGVEPAEVLVIGGGVVGANAARVAAGMGARVTLLDVNLDRLRYLADVMPANVRTLMSDTHTIEACIRSADLVIGAVLIAGARAPVLLRRSQLKLMKPRAVIVDVAIDQGGCFETSRPTTHSDPTYTVDGILHYCVANIPGAVSRTSTYALTNATIPYAVKIANLGLLKAAAKDIAIKRGVNVLDGKITCPAVAEAFNLKCCAF